MVSPAQAELLDPADAKRNLLGASARRTLAAVGKQYGGLPSAELKTAAYMTRQMRELLRREKALRLNMFNSAVFPPPR